MAFNIFKKKKPEKQEPQAAEAEQAKEAQKEEEKAPKKTKTRAAVPGVISLPHITEKAAVLAEQGKYVFRVGPFSTKGAVRQAVETVYGVSVQSVRMQMRPAKTIRVGKKQGVKPGFKKAIVQLKKGETIELALR